MPDPSKREELRARVHARAKQIRFRRRLQVAGALAATTAVIAAIAGVALLPSDPVRDVREVAHEPVATELLTPTPDPAPSPTDVPTPAPTPHGPTECRNSYDPACGEFRWDPEPKNAPMEAEVESQTVPAMAGEPVTFVVSVTDDSPHGVSAPSREWGDGTSETVSASCMAPRERYGPWTPSPPEHSIEKVKLTHTYEEPGTYEVTFGLSNGPCVGHFEDPYWSATKTKTTIKVAPMRSPGPLDTPQPQ